MSTHADVFVIGAGPAGLTAAYCLTKENPSVIVIEKDPVYVGGISRTVEYNGFMFDIGGHRFFSKSKEVVDLWQEILPNDFIERPRLSRIYYGGKYYSYPLSAFEALRNLGLFTSAACMLSFAYAKARPIKDAANFHRMGAQPVRRETVLDLLQDLHRESVGHVVRRDFRRLGRATHQGARSRRRGARRAEEGAPAPQAQAESRRAGGQDADRKLPVPAPWPRHDVGSGLTQDPEARRQSAQGPRIADVVLRSRRKALAHRGFAHRRRQRTLHRAPCRQLGAGPRAGREDHPDADLAAACAELALSRFPHCRADGAKSPISSPTTGSTSTIRRCRSAAYRTSARGRPKWCSRA